MNNEINMGNGTYVAREQQDTQVSGEINSKKAAENDNKNFFGWTLRRRKSSKKLPSKPETCEVAKHNLQRENNERLLQRDLPKVPTNIQAIYNEISEKNDLNTDSSDPDYATISELFLNVDQNHESTESPIKIWDNLALSYKLVLKEISAKPIFESIKDAIKTSLGNKNDCRYILARFAFNSLTYVQPENSNYLPMNGVKSPANLEILFEKMVSIILQDLDELFHTEISHSDCFHENVYSIMRSEPVYVNQSNPSLFKKVQEGELKKVQEELPIAPCSRLN
ncbi:hypothetical protein [Rickettsiella endosymbiont of Xylota segnis]|uniref:hypothetical protein n=1 Tax=Rickettsiella endosymbiont of Xylota segnis TaxID=3066238 RepID=UPI0030CC9263